MDRLNRLLVSQHAEALLREAGQTPDPSAPYLLQLASWAIRSGRIGVHIVEPGNPWAANDYVECLDYATFVRPERAMKILLEEGPDEGAPDTKWLDQSILLSRKTPEEAASYIGECFMSAFGW